MDKTEPEAGEPVKSSFGEGIYVSVFIVKYLFTRFDYFFFEVYLFTLRERESQADFPL